MKKTICIIAAAVITLSLAGCGKTAAKAPSELTEVSGASSAESGAFQSSVIAESSAAPVSSAASSKAAVSSAAAASQATVSFDSSAEPAPLDKVITVDEAQLLLEEKYGIKDSDSGFPMSYGYAETVTKNGKYYYHFVVSWLVENDHMSKIGDAYVLDDGTDMYIE